MLDAVLSAATVAELHCTECMRAKGLLLIVLSALLMLKDKYSIEQSDEDGAKAHFGPR